MRISRTKSSTKVAEPTTSRRNQRLGRAGGVALRVALGAMLACGTIFSLALAADQFGAATVKGFQSPLEFFDPPNELKMKSYLEGAEARPGANGTILIRDARLKTFHENGSNDMTVTAPECIFDSRQHTVNSAGHFKYEGADDKLTMEGVGFYWSQTNSYLIISNQQRTKVSGPLTNSFSP